MAVPNVMTMVLAGGEGKRLAPLTADRAKPAVPFGGHYRIVDFALSNLANAGYLQIVVLTQYKSHSLDRHIARTWRLSTLLGNYVTPVPAQMRRRPALVRRLGRRHLPEPQPRRRRAARTTSWSSAPTTSTAWIPGQMVEQHIATGRRRHRRRHPGAAQPRPTSSA